MTIRPILRDLLDVARVATGADHAALVVRADGRSIEVRSPETAPDFMIDVDTVEVESADHRVVEAPDGTVTSLPIVGPDAESGWIAVHHGSRVTDQSVTIDVVSRIARLIEERLDREAEQLRLDELGELLRTNQERLHLTRDELSLSNQELEQFAYIAAHELVAPLRAVAVYAEVLESVTPFPDASAAGARDCVNQIRSGVQQMTRQVQALLDLSTGQLDPDSLGPIELSAIVQAALDTLAPTLDEIGASVHVDQLPVVLATPVPLQSVFANLFGNAIRYRSESEPLSIRVEAIEVQTGFRIAVSDNGSGVAEVDRARIFQMFERASSSDDGSGIGLALSRKILSTYGASISVEPGAESGSVFLIDFPAIITGASAEAVRG